MEEPAAEEALWGLPFQGLLKKGFHLPEELEHVYACFCSGSGMAVVTLQCPLSIPNTQYDIKKKKKLIKNPLNLIHNFSHMFYKEITLNLKSAIDPTLPLSLKSLKLIVLAFKEIVLI